MAGENMEGLELSGPETTEVNDQVQVFPMPSEADINKLEEAVKAELKATTPELEIAA